MNTTKQEAERQKEREWAAAHFGIPIEDVKWHHSGFCYDRIGVLTKESADKVSAMVDGQTVNGGMFHGMGLGGQTHYKKENGHDPEYWDVMC